MGTNQIELTLFSSKKKFLFNAEDIILCKRANSITYIVVDGKHYDVVESYDLVKDLLYEKLKNNAVNK